MSRARQPARRSWNASPWARSRPRASSQARDRSARGTRPRSLPASTRAAREPRSSRTQVRCRRERRPSEPQERVEGDDLVHLAAADVHVVGDRVGQLHRDRSHLAANASEVVEQAGSLAWKLRKQRCEPEHVHRRESIPRSAASGAPSSAPGAACCRVDAPSLPCPGESQPGAAERRAPPGASRRAARLRARDSETGSARPARRRAAPARLARRHAASACRSAPWTPRPRTVPRPAWTTSGRADRRGHSSVRPAA